MCSAPCPSTEHLGAGEIFQCKTDKAGFVSCVTHCPYARMLFLILYVSSKQLTKHHSNEWKGGMLMPSRCLIAGEAFPGREPGTPVNQTVLI